MDNPRYEHLNERQMKSEERFRSWQSVWIKGKHRECQFDEEAPPDPDPMDPPGEYNPNCLYGVDDITIKYEVSLKINMNPRHVTRENGRVDIVKPPKHVKWKWLYNWAKAAQTNWIYKELVTPWGTFFLFNHSLERVHFPTQKDPRCVARFSTQFVASAKPGKVLDPEGATMKTYNQYIQDHNGKRIPVFEGFQRPIPIGCKDVKWESVKDTYRYCFIFEHVLDDKDRSYTLYRDKIFHSAKEMIGRAIYFQFNAWFGDVCDYIARIREDGYTRRSLVEPNYRYNQRENYTEVREFPTEDEFENWKFHLGWTPSPDDEFDDFQVHNEAASKALQRSIEIRRRAQHRQ